MELQNTIVLEYLIAKCACVELEGFACSARVCVTQVAAQTAGHSSRELNATLLTVQLSYSTEGLLV